MRNIPIFRFCIIALVALSSLLGSNLVSPQRSEAAPASVLKATGKTQGLRVYHVPQAKATTLTKAWLDTLKRYEGIREIGGNNRGPGPKAFLASVGLSQGYAYCAAFAYYTFERTCRAIQAAPIALARTAGARQMLHLTARNGILVSSTRAGEAGQLMVFQKPGTAWGHVAVVLANCGDGTLLTIEANTGPDGGRDGDGVYRKRRPLRGYASLRTEGFIKFV